MRAGADHLMSDMGPLAAVPKRVAVHQTSQFWFQNVWSQVIIFSAGLWPLEECIRQGAVWVSAALGVLLIIIAQSIFSSVMLCATVVICEGSISKMIGETMVASLDWDRVRKVEIWKHPRTGIEFVSLFNRSGSRKMRFPLPQRYRAQVMQLVYQASSSRGFEFIGMQGRPQV
jgi:hypothetical protein